MISEQLFAESLHAPLSDGWLEIDTPPDLSAFQIFLPPSVFFFSNLQFSVSDSNSRLLYSSAATLLYKPSCVSLLLQKKM